MNPSTATAKTVTKTTKKTVTKKTVTKKTTTSKKRTLPGGLVVEDMRVGSGPVAKAGQQVTVHYRGKLTNGKIFDESYKRGQPFQFMLGAGQVIKGWDQGVAGMKVGGKRRLTIPSSLGYGPGGTPDGSIPPNATLIFDVELLHVG
ncbi:MAG: FKBP-type peptidyl-prolyl cis-trans isomerase [Abitibacteriaceae bacterium]|nr:FKBP-type peptidyl-prolyl cis-trans isomerase [Abditibacteriaceae bacterium]